MKTSLFGSVENNSILLQSGSLSFSRFKLPKLIIRGNLTKSIFINSFPNLHLNSLKLSPKKQSLLRYRRIPNHFPMSLLSNKNQNSKKSTCLGNAGTVFKQKVALLFVSIHGFNKTEMANLPISWIKCILVYKVGLMIIWLNRK